MVLEAQYVGLRTLTSGCVRLTFDVPLERLEDVVALFRKEGDPAAIARLAVEHDKAEEPEKPKRQWADLTPAEQAGIRCNEPLFQEYAAFRAGRPAVDTADWVRGQCCVVSRSELRRDTPEGDLWKMVEADYQSWLTTRKYGEHVR